MINYLIKYPIIATSMLAAFIPLIIMLVRGVHSMPLRIFFLYLVSKIVFDFSALYYAAQSKNSLLICNLWILTSFLLTAAFFYNIFPDKKYRRLIVEIIAGFCIVFFFDLWHCNKNFMDLHNHRYVSVSASLKCGLSMFMCLMFYWRLIKELDIDRLERSAVFWIVCAFFIYNSASLFAVTINYPEFTWHSKELLISIMYMPYIFDAVMLLISSVGLLLQKKN